MRKYCNSLLIVIYLVSGLLTVSGSGMHSSAQVTISSNKGEPRTQYFTTAKIPTHIAPVSFTRIDVHDYCTVLEEAESDPVISITVESDLLYAAPILSLPLNKAPPQIIS